MKTDNKSITMIQDHAPNISIVVPIFNEAHCIEGVLIQLLAQSYDPECIEILVIDGQSTDGTQDLVQKYADRYPNVHLFENPHRLSSAARNIGIRHASGDVVLIIDGHCELENDHLLTNVAEAFETSGADCVGRPQPQDIRAATALQRAISAARSSWLGHHPDSFIYSDKAQFVPAASVAVAYRRDVFEKVGYFDENFDACEDYEFNIRCDKAGLKCYFTPNAAVSYQPRASLCELFKQLFRYGRGRIRMMRKHPETFSSRTLLPALMVAGIVPGLMLAGFSSTMAIAWFVAVGVYLAVIGIASAQLAVRHADLPLAAWLPIVFPTIHFGAGTGLLLEAVRSCRRQDAPASH
ncbi:MAG: glycosyltransferase family 2 protein [Pirellulales bacterium]|nr:glycosyltransferase family 2 protein [Pirellulales bacterium]